jgi:hypothetical protein
VSFIPAGATPPRKRRKAPFSGCLHKANDWKLLVDYLDAPYVFPPEILATNLRPDIIIWSTSRKIIIIIELTCPMEENLLTQMHLKIARYTGLKSDLESNGWKVVLHTIEVGARGYVHDKTFQKCFRGLGFAPRATAKIKKNLSLLAVRASTTIYQHRNKPLWPVIPLLRPVNCVLTEFEKLHFKVSSLSADCWTPTFDFKGSSSSSKSKLESVPEHRERSARAEAISLLASIAPGLQAERSASAEQ